jgi:hypothetical protein
MKKIGRQYVGLFMFGPTYHISQGLYKNDFQWKIPIGNYINPISFVSTCSFMVGFLNIFKLKAIKSIKPLLSFFFYNLGNIKIFKNLSIALVKFTSLLVSEDINPSENLYNYSDYIMQIEFENELNNNTDRIIATDNFKI